MFLPMRLAAASAPWRAGSRTKRLQKQKNSFGILFEQDDTWAVEYKESRKVIGSVGSIAGSGKESRSTGSSVTCFQRITGDVESCRRPCPP